MSLFGSIMSKIFGQAKAADAAPAATSAPAGADTTPPPTTSATPPPQSVDVVAVLTTMASAKGGGGNWKTSIVDLLKLLDLDSSLNARKELASELGVQAAAGSAEGNIALHKAVMRKLAENGGKVPDDLKD